MRIAYLILAHGNPAHLGRLVAALTSGESSLFVHIDAKTDIHRFRAIQEGSVHWTSRRVPVYWGEYSMVEAILLLLREAMAAGRYEYFVLLSGSDYPIRSKQYIHQYLTRHAGAEFISIAPVPTPEAGISLGKVNRIAVPSSRPALKVLMKICARLGMADRDYRKQLGPLQPYSGSTWWALTRDACGHILEFANRDRSFCKYFEYTYSSDESFFQTILGNSPFSHRIRRSLMYDDWSAGGVHPGMIDERHLALFERRQEVTLDDPFGPGELLFARKFSDESAALTERIDEMAAMKDQIQEVGPSAHPDPSRTAVSSLSD